MAELTAGEYSMEELVFFVILDASDSLDDLKFALLGKRQADQEIPPWEVIEDQARIRAGLPEVRMHDLRHSVASN